MEKRILSPYEGFQKQFVASDLDFVIGGGAMGGGKEQPLNALVLTSKGYVKMGDLKEGDYVSTPFDGQSKIIRIYEHKNKDIYRITTTDGRVCECGLSHWWCICDSECDNKKVVDTYTMIKMLNNGDSVFIPIPNEQYFDKKFVFFSPYLLGLLGIVPKRYIYNSLKTRMLVLKGLEKRFCKNGVYIFHKDRIKNRFKELVASLGFTTNEYPTLLKDYITISNSSCVQIKSIELLPEKQDTRCIYIDSYQHLYITNDFITTHNTTAAVMSIAEPSLDPKFRSVFLRNNLGDLKSGGGILDEFRNIYGSSIDVIESGDPHVNFPSGARADVTHIADQSREKVLQRFKGRQYDFIYFDEGTGFTWECFSALFSRNRGQAKWTGKVRMTTNPKRNHWIRTFIDWYIGLDGYIIPQRNGVVRYFYLIGKSVKDVVWGDTKEEVYQRCRAEIDRVLVDFNKKHHNRFTYKHVIKSFTFYEGKMSDNKAIMDSNSGYIGSVAMMGGNEAMANLMGNWNVDSDVEAESLIDGEMFTNFVTNDPQVNGDRWITADLADTGTDNFVAIVWNGLHIIDIKIVMHSTPRQNADILKTLAIEHNIADSHIIFDAIRAVYINDYLPDALPFISNSYPRGVYARQFAKLKDECFMRVVEAFKRRYLSIESHILDLKYTHQLLKTDITIENELKEETMVVAFKDMPSGKKALLTKKEMNAKLGQGRSMDLIDPIAMRFLPLLNHPYGRELLGGGFIEEEPVYEGNDSVNIFDETFWA